MISYQFIRATFPIQDIVCIKRDDDAFIPLDPENTDYQQFLVDWEAGATVLSSTGVPLPWGSDPS
jgi:hypothetical protein